MTYLQSSDGDLDEQFIKIVSTQALCLLKLGDFLMAKNFAEQDSKKIYINILV